jgi:hypothetical protein
MAGGYQQMHNREKKLKESGTFVACPATTTQSYQHGFQQMLITLLLDITVSYNHILDIVHINQALKVTRGGIFFQGKSIRRIGLIHNKCLDIRGYYE